MRQENIREQTSAFCDKCEDVSEDKLEETQYLKTMHAVNRGQKPVTFLTC
jgi:hypothetical protein